MTNKVTMCDPPSGWRYGFPKAIPDHRRNDLKRWLIEEGYPEFEINFLGEYFYCRFWTQEV